MWNMGNQPLQTRTDWFRAPDTPGGSQAGVQAGDAEQQASLHTDLKVDLHQALIDRLNLAALETMDRERLHQEVGELVNTLLSQRKHALNAMERKQLVNDVLDELLGLGPLEPLLKDPSVTDILVNTHRLVFVERYGVLEPTAVRFKDERHLARIITRIVTAVGRRVDESAPMVDARLADGSRINAVVPPLAVDGSLLSIRKFSRTPISMKQLVDTGSIDTALAEILRAIVRARRNILISGGTGSGKTTLLNAMSAAIGERERIVTIEDSAELQLQQVHVARLETRPPNIEGKGEVTQRHLVKNALRMRPDRIIVGEVRAGEAFDMLQAMNTGHDGSMTTVHANSPRDALSRIEQMVGISGVDIPVRSLRAQIASAVHIVLQVERMLDGRRRVVSLSEIAGMENDIITMQEIYRFRRTGVDPSGIVQGFFEATGVRPRFCAHLATYGIHLPVEIFQPRPPGGQA